MEVRWVDGAVTHSERLTVRARDSTVVVSGGNEVMAFEPFERLVSHRGQRWEELWQATMAPAVRPDSALKYQVTSLADGPQVAGRPTTTLEVRQGGILRERLYLDVATRIPLEHEQYDAGGAITRTSTFQTLTIGDIEVPAHPSSPMDHAPTPVGVPRPGGSLAPAALDEGYQRQGLYRAGDALQVLYSDGIYDLSVFEQAGRLRRGDLPSSGERVMVGNASGRRYAWAGGQLVVWSSGATVFTAVGDAPLDQVLQAVRSIPVAPDPAPSLLGKLRRACRAVMEPLS